MSTKFQERLYLMSPSIHDLRSCDLETFIYSVHRISSLWEDRKYDKCQRISTALQNDADTILSHFSYFML
jgi:hypothetical protein